MEALKQYGLALQFAPAFQCDIVVVMAALKQDGEALEFASNDLKLDIAVVMTAVQQNGTALQFAPAFQGDIVVVMAALKQYGEALEFAPTLRSDPEFACDAVINNPDALQFVDDSLDKNN